MSAALVTRCCRYSTFFCTIPISSATIEATFIQAHPGHRESVPTHDAVLRS